MFALLVFLLQPSASFPPTPIGYAARQIISAGQETLNLKDVLRRRLQTIETQNHGVFHEDVTADVASLFPIDQPFQETQRIVQAQDIGPLSRFKGEPHQGTVMYVARSRLIPEISGDVYVVIDFDFAGRSEADMRLKAVRAFLRASYM